MQNKDILPYSLKFSMGTYSVVFPNSAQEQIFAIKFSRSSAQPHIAFVMN